jgi:hypothetical protein
VLKSVNTGLGKNEFSGPCSYFGTFLQSKFGSGHLCGAGQGG